MSVAVTSFRCECGETITEWQRYDLGGYEIVHGEGDSAPSLFIPTSEAIAGRGNVNRDRIAAWVAGVHQAVTR